MKILVTGATGFTGSRVVPCLLEQGWDVACFVRETSDTGHLPLDRVELRYGDLEERKSLIQALEGVETLVNVASLGSGVAADIIQAAKAAGIKRGVFFSTTSVFTTLNPDSKAIRLEAERLIKESGIPYTILRPTMIYGSPRDRNLSKFINFINLSPIFPVFGSGEYHLQPVFVDDLAQAVVSVLSTDETVDQVYNLSGGSVLTLNQFAREISDSLGKRTWLLHLPPGPFIGLLSLMEGAKIGFPITSEQIRRFNEHKAFSHQRAAEDFGYSPRSFAEGLALELKEMGLTDD